MSCFEYNGSPLWMNADNKSILIGVTSEGLECNSNKYVISVQEFLPWIHETIAQDKNATAACVLQCSTRAFAIQIVLMFRAWRLLV